MKAFARSQLDLAKLDQVRSTLSETEFDLLINCAALTNVDYCESHRDEAFLLNAEGPRLLAEICAEKSAKLVHISTDYVFGGKQDTPYIEADPPAPLSVYAESKLEGERERVGSFGKQPGRPSFLGIRAGQAELYRSNHSTRARKQNGNGGGGQVFLASLHNRRGELVAPGLGERTGGFCICANSGECSWQEWAQYAIEVCRNVGIR